ncbi:hypothetical protein PFISCL1PPCAC_25984, partial [Pristionchus fissidentatus]
NTMFNEIALNLTGESNPWLILGMVCNSNTRRMEWMDGSKITYTYKNFDVSFDCVANKTKVDSEPGNHIWNSYASTYWNYWTVLCVAERYDCDEYDKMANSDDVAKPCFKIYPDALSWR